MSADLVLGFVVLPGVSFGLAYFPMLRLSRALISPYPKADMHKRLSAAFTDALLVFTTGVLYWNSSFVLYLVAGSAYLLLRDAIRGQSIGKCLFGLAVISLETGRPATLAASVRRNLVLLLPGANIVAVFLEAGTLVRDPQGQRLGDRLAQTQVVEGFGARDLVRSFQEWLLGLGEQARVVGKRGRAPVRLE